jgi:small subunit ribosomal protein S2
MNEKNNEQKIDVKLPSPQEMVEAGVHFGHKTSRWHPKMEQYIFSSRNSIHIFDLEKTAKKLEEAITFLSRVVSHGGLVVFVGTKPISRSLIKAAAQELGMPFVSERWIGGTLTNFKTINKRIQYLTDLEEQQKTGQWEKFTKKEQLVLKRKMEKLQFRFEGIRKLNKLPEALFAIDVKADNLAIREAKKIKIPVVSICDTNMDPKLIDYVIPANDDASSSLKIIVDAIVDNLKKAKPPIVVAE